MRSEYRRKATTFWALIAGVVVLDVITKTMAVRSLTQGIVREVFGQWARLTLVYNPGAAFGMHVGSYSRWVFLTLTLIALFILGRLYQATRPSDRVRLVALGLVCGGAVGNLIDRVRSSQGVVDFIDLGVGDARWPTFNVADIAVSCGAILLAYALWGEDQREERGTSPSVTPTSNASERV